MMQPACLRSWGASFLPGSLSPEQTTSLPDVWVAVAKWLALGGMLSTCVTFWWQPDIIALARREGGVSAYLT